MFINSRLLSVASILSSLILLPGCTGSTDRSVGPDASSSPRGSASSSRTPTTATSEPRPQFAGHRIGKTFFGMHDGRMSSGVAPDAPVGSVRLWDSGTSWAQLETEPGRFTWGPLDVAITTAEGIGARPLLVLGQTPSFYASRPGQAAAYGPGAASMPSIAAWRRYVGAVAARYGDRIDYQVWNEVNVVGFWTGTSAEMARLTIIASHVIRKTVPNATVVAPPFALRLTGQRRSFDQFWSLTERGRTLAAAVDAVAVHLYPPADGTPEDQVELVDFAKQVLHEHGVDLPIWNTEVNYGLQGGPEPPTISAERQRSYLMRTYLLDAGLGLERVYWYSWNIGRIANTYLTNEDLATETLAGRAFDTVRAWLEGGRPERCESNGGGRGIWKCDTYRASMVRSFYWKPRGSAARVVVEGARSWVDADGRVTRCAESCVLQVGGTPVMVDTPR